MFSFVSFSSPVIVLVLGILVFFSVVSWAIIVLKLLQIRSLRRASQTFLDFFWETRDFATVEAQLERFAPCPPLVLFREGFRETRHFLQLRPTHETLSVALGALENISRSLRKVSSLEIEKLEKDLSFLATTASTTPFIGLFGTVWGIMQAFQNIGQAGSTSLAIVAPGISEALITTAIGLAVAIPAVIGFNFLQNKIRRFVTEIDNFCADFLNVVQRVLNTARKE
jgi:biopolymer transport protein TolQ